MQLDLKANAVNTSAQFKKYLYSFHINSTAGLSGLTGSVALASGGQAFAEALISLQDIPAGKACPQDGEGFPSYSAIRAHYPAMRRLVSFILKAPAGVRAAAAPTTFVLPTAIPVSGCLVVILDGGSAAGGPFAMSSSMVAHLVKPPEAAAAPTLVGLDDEFCFGLDHGCRGSPSPSSLHASFMKAVRVVQPGALRALYGNVSDSTFGARAAVFPGRIAWTAENGYFIYHHCKLVADSSGIRDYYREIPPDAVRLHSLVVRGYGQVSLHQPVFQAFAGVPLVPGDCLVHLVRSSEAADLGGVDAESQVFALVQPTRS